MADPAVEIQVDGMVAALQDYVRSEIQTAIHKARIVIMAGADPLKACDDAFHKLTVKQRDDAWAEIRGLKVELDGARADAMILRGLLRRVRECITDDGCDVEPGSVGKCRALEVWATDVDRYIGRSG